MFLYDSVYSLKHLKEAVVLAACITNTFKMLHALMWIMRCFSPAVMKRSRFCTCNGLNGVYIFDLFKHGCDVTDQQCARARFPFRGSWGSDEWALVWG